MKSELGVEITQLEVWHDEANQNEMRKYTKEFNEACRGFLGVPAFLNQTTDEALCDEQDYETLKKWATKK